LEGKPLASIVSAGLSKFGKLDGLYAREIFAEAAKEAFDNCPKLEPKLPLQEPKLPALPQARHYELQFVLYVQA
jgi:hypothetical protein